jgi:hypothetical protein
MKNLPAAIWVTNLCPLAHGGKTALRPLRKDWVRNLENGWAIRSEGGTTGNDTEPQIAITLAKAPSSLTCVARVFRCE